MRLRKENNQQREYSASLGVLGTEATLEGPFKKGGGSSYLLNYRYYTLTLLNDLGLVNYGGIPKYQDIFRKVDCHRRHNLERSPQFSFHGIDPFINHGATHR